MNEPLVSVLMTAYNREKYIAAAIESVLASIYTNFELIVVDDCSKDTTVAIANQYAATDARVKVFVNENNLSDYVNRNKAATYATGKYIKYVDSDDILYPHSLYVMISAMEKFPAAGFGLSSKHSSEYPFPLCISPKEAYVEHFYRYGHFDRSPGAAIIKKEVFELLGGFSGKKYVGDLEFWYKIARYYPMVKFSHDLYWSRVHEDRQSTDEARIKKETVKLRNDIMKEALENPDVPLSADEIRKVKKRVKRQSLKYYFKRLKFFIWS